MNIKKLQEIRIVTKEGHFLPLIFVDMSVPAAYMAAGATFAGREIQKEWNNRKKSYSPIPLLVPYRHTSGSFEERERLISSIDDIHF